jgi:hypothetical protein
MNDDSKKTREREVFDSVYASRPPFEVLPSERPDFLARLREPLPMFGVEIAEFYDSEVEARIRQIPGYVGALLEGRPFRHKRDRQDLTVDEVSITGPNGEVKASAIPAIIRQVPSLDACATMVSEIIRTKDAKLEAAFATCSHVNLIIADQTHLLGHLEPSAFYRLYCTPALRRAVFASGFREICFVTSFKARRAFVPLKLLLTLAQLYFFHAAVRRSGRIRAIERVADFMRLFADYLIGIARGPVGLRSDPLGLEVMYGDTGFLVSEKLAVTMRTYNDWPWPEGEVIERSLVAPLEPALADAVLEFEENHTFTTDIAFSVDNGGLPNKAVQPTSRERLKAKPRKRPRAARG